MPYSVASLFWSVLLGACLLGLQAEPVHAQSRSQQASPQRQAAPSQSGQAPARSGRSNPPGTRVPSAAESGQAPSYRQSPGGTAQTNDGSAPGTPSEGEQVPLGGAEWLAAAGAAYALNRLRKEGDDEDEDDSDDEMP